ncbi:MAG TPA: SDR family oxidoreductase [Pyrinomonadaceae bacterium]|jgi:nucleoside-diphosphate-sugar epimerase|nr:SDR family oxidoreductase [Pyrinomonadaceae bacterium]
MRNVLLHVSGRPFVALHLLDALRARPEVAQVFLLDSTPERGPAKRAQGASPKLKIFSGELPTYQRGARGGVWQEFADEIDTVLYCGEGGGESGAEQAPDAGPLKSWLAFLEDRAEVRLGFLSTAFVAGRRRGLFTEFDLDCGQSFDDAWQRRAFESERLLRASAAGGRVTVYRPSHVVGDSRSGEAHAFGGLYPVLRALRRGRLNLLAGDARARLDIVPVNYVVNSLIELSLRPEVAGRTYHLVGGWHRSMPVKEFVRFVGSHGRGSVAKVFVVPPVLAGALRGRGERLATAAVFDDYMARVALEPRGLSCPPAESYLGPVIEFAEGRGWTAPGGSG